MMPFQRILVPVALSPACGWAARYAAGLAAQFGADLTFLHVTAHSDQELNAFLNAEIPGTIYRSVVLRGDPAEEIVRFAKDQLCDLILMPTHAHGPFRRFLLGSVTAKVLHDALCPVWTGVHRQDASTPDHAAIRSIVCAVDVDDGCIGVIRSARELAGRLKAHLKIVHAEPAVDETSDNPGEIQVRRYLFCRAQEKFSALFDAANFPATIKLAGGPIARVVRETALYEHADLVVIGRGHTQSGLGRLQTAAYSIIRESPCPVLSI